MSRPEQLETWLWLAVDEHAASGMLLQKLPDQAEDDVDAWPRFIQLANTLREDELMHLPAEALLHRLFHEEDVRVFEARPVSFHCSCTRDNVAQMLRMFGEEEVESYPGRTANHRGALRVLQSALRIRQSRRRTDIHSNGAVEVSAIRH